MTHDSNVDTKELFYSTLKTNFIKALADGGVQISEDVAPEFVQAMTKSLHEALDTTFKEVGPTLIAKDKG